MTGSPKFIVIADDFTGGSATGALFAKRGMKAYCVSIEKSANYTIPENCDVLICVTDSRQMSPKDAYQRVAGAFKELISPEKLLYNKRIDTTLRGNVTAETEAMLDSLGDGYAAAIVAVYPSAGRIVRDGELFVDGLPLSESAVTGDPYSTVQSSQVADYFRGSEKYKAVNFTASDYASGVQQVTGQLIIQYKNGARLFLFDGANDADLEFISKAMLLSGLKFIAVDPGPFSAACADAISEREASRRTLVLVGSMHPVMANQVKQLRENTDSCLVIVKTGELIQGDLRRREEIKRAANEIFACEEGKFTYAVVGDGLFNPGKLALESQAMALGLTKKELATLIANAFGEIALKILDVDRRYTTLFTSGGDIAYAVFNHLGASSIKVLDEISPLIVYSQLVSSRFPDIRLITKGGSIGDTDSLLNALSYAKRHRQGKQI